LKEEDQNINISYPKSYTLETIVLDVDRSALNQREKKGESLTHLRQGIDAKHLPLIIMAVVLNCVYFFQRCK
jgi:hypothetical protein